MAVRKPKKERLLSDRMRQVISSHRRYAGAFLNLHAGACIFAALCLLMGVAGVVCGALPLGEVAVRVFLVVAGGLLFLCGAGLFVLVWRKMYHSPSLVKLYPFGVKWEAGGEEHEYDWDEVTEVYRSEVITVTKGGRSRRAHVTLYFEDGETLECTNALKNYDDLAARLMNETANTLLARARRQLEKDEEVDFGPVGLSRKGVTIADDFYPWDELRQTRVRNGHILFYFPRKQKYEFPLGEVPNYLALFGLLEDQGKPGIIDQRPDPD